MQSNYFYNSTTSPDVLMEHRAVTTNLEDNIMDYDPNYNSEENMSRDVSVEFASIEPPNNHGRNDNSMITSQKVITGNLKMPPNSNVFKRLHNPDFLAHMEIYDILYRAKTPLYVHNLMINCIMRNMDNGALHLSQNEYSRKTF